MSFRYRRHACFTALSTSSGVENPMVLAASSSALPSSRPINASTSLPMNLPLSLKALRSASSTESSSSDRLLTPGGRPWRSTLSRRERRLLSVRLLLNSRFPARSKSQASNSFSVLPRKHWHRLRSSSQVSCARSSASCPLAPFFLKNTTKGPHHLEHNASNVALSPARTRFPKHRHKRLSPELAPAHRRPQQIRQLTLESGTNSWYGISSGPNRSPFLSSLKYSSSMSSSRRNLFVPTTTTRGTLAPVASRTAA